MTTHGVAFLCRLLEVARPSFYAWLAGRKLHSDAFVAPGDSLTLGECLAGIDSNPAASLKFDALASRDIAFLNAMPSTAAESWSTSGFTERPPSGRCFGQCSSPSADGSSPWSSPAATARRKPPWRT